MEPNPKLAALKLFLDRLGVKDDISTVDDRKRVQKAVYLGQAAGADLGYRFSWYLMGPYSRSLTDDYYALDSKRAAIQEGSSRVRLHPQYREALDQLKPLLDKPTEFKLSIEKWYELLASYHYLRTVSKLSHDEALNKFEMQKEQLAPYVSLARKTLRSSAPLKTS